MESRGFFERNNNDTYLSIYLSFHLNQVKRREKKKRECFWEAKRILCSIWIRLLGMKWIVALSCINFPSELEKKTYHLTIMFLPGCFTGNQQLGLLWNFSEGMFRYSLKRLKDKIYYDWKKIRTANMQKPRGIKFSCTTIFVLTFFHFCDDVVSFELKNENLL